MFKKNSKKSSKEKIDEKATSIPKVVFTYEVMLKMNQIVNTCKAEVGWLGSVKKEENRYLVDDIYLLKQSVTGTTTELDEEAMHDFFNDLIINDPEKYNSMRLWGHSHVQMAVFASTQDNETFKEYYQECPFFIRLIANQKEEMKVDIAVKEDGYIYYDIPWYIEYPADIVKAMQDYETALKVAEEAEKEVTTIKENLENSFKETISKEIKDKVIEDGYVFNSSKSKASPYLWTDDEMEDYSTWWDAEGYEEMYAEYEDRLMKQCDAKKLIKYQDKGKVTHERLTSVYDAWEIIEMGVFASWKELKAYLATDERTAGYFKHDWVELFESIKETMKEYERKTA